jgi:hypothetical protein
MELNLMDNTGRELGRAIVSFGNDCYMIGGFSSNENFSLYAALFKEHERLVNEQCFFGSG